MYVLMYVCIKVCMYVCINVCIPVRIRGEVSHPASCSTNSWVFEKPYKKSRFLGVLALTKSIGF